MWQRLMNVLRAIVGIFIGHAEDAVGEENLLRQDRERRGQKVRAMGEKVDDVGMYAEKTRDALADAKRKKDDFLAQAEALLVDAKNARAAGKEDEALNFEEDAQSLVLQATEEDDYITQLTADLTDALSGHKQALEMVLRQARDLSRLDQGDARLIAKKRMAELKEGMQKSLEETLTLIPKESGNDVRARIQERATTMDQRNRARQVRLDAFLKAENTKQRAEATRTTAKSAALMASLKEKAGYAPQGAAPAEAADLTAKIEALKKQS